MTAPYESELSVATRLRDSASKKVFRKLPIGTVVELDAAHGDFTLQKNQSTPAVFIVDGIGVTPVRSMIGQATHDKTSHVITLIHANRSPGDAPFANDFKRLAEWNRHFMYVPVFTQTGADGAAPHGHVDADLIRQHVPRVAAPIYHLSGPAGMVKAMRKLLVEIGANEDNICTEEFEGH